MIISVIKFKRKRRVCTEHAL